MIEVHHMECLSHMRTMADNSVDAIITDPPYFGVKDDDWDNQWRDEAHFIEWIGELCVEWKRILRPNGSLYCFASPRMSWGVESAIRKHFNVLTNIRWQKPPFSTKAEMYRKEDLRSYFPASETIVFAEQFGTDEHAEGEAGYTSACEAVKRGVFGDYLRLEFERAGVSNREIAALFPSATGGLTGCVSNWLQGYNCPTPQQYEAMRAFLNNREGEYLRTQYEELRRPFNVTPEVPYTDVWTFKTVQAYEGKHVCEKPIALMEHIVLASTKPGAIVFDPFSGSGSTGVACVMNDRQFIGCEMDAHWHKYATARITKAARQPRLFNFNEQPHQLTIDPAA